MVVVLLTTVIPLFGKSLLTLVKGSEWLMIALACNGPVLKALWALRTLGYPGCRDSCKFMPPDVSDIADEVDSRGRRARDPCTYRAWFCSLQSLFSWFSTLRR
ncbi:hypothetical protein Efla_000541 [Eimeria flavescens]